MEAEDFAEEYESFEDEYGEDAEYEKDAHYEAAFEEVVEEETMHTPEKKEDVEYEMDEVVGARDKKPIMSKLNQRELDPFEMDDLLNQI